jgi:hypothetical protein
MVEANGKDIRRRLADDIPVTGTIMAELIGP